MFWFRQDERRLLQSYGSRTREDFFSHMARRLSHSKNEGRTGLCLVRQLDCHRRWSVRGAVEGKYSMFC
jgi:hypothetical protein